MAATPHPRTTPRSRVSCPRVTPPYHRRGDRCAACRRHGPAASSRRRFSSASPSRRCAISASVRRSIPSRPVLVERRDTADVRTRSAGNGPPADRDFVADGPPGTVPDLHGMSAREAVRTLVRLGLTAQLSGDGFVMSQDPPAGAVLEPGAVCTPGAESVGRARRVGRPAMTLARASRRLLRARHAPTRIRLQPDWSTRTAPSQAVAYDSRTVEPGAVFVALKGLHADGAAFVRQALDRGAAAIVVGAAAFARTGSAASAVPWCPGSSCRTRRLALAQIAAAFLRHPSAEMQVVGITGTNGKTTTAYLLSSIFEAAGIRCGVLGTVAYRIGDELREATRTTPEAPDVQQLLREMVDRGCGACAMEVSSHALALRRVDETSFAAAVFTNLTRDHLDFHEDMEQYFQAKRRLFEMLPRDSPSLLNVDDPRGASLAGIVGRPVTFAIGRPADITPGPLSFSLAGLTFDVRTPRGTLRVRSKLVGRPNVYNILAAVATGVALDVPFDAIERGVSALEGVPGRFQIVSSDKDGVTVVVDYAHTDDALAQPARDGAAAGHRPADYGVWLRRRSRSDQAPVDGRGGRTAERSHHRDVRQPAQRGSQADHRGDPARHHARHETRQRPAAAVDRRSAGSDRAGRSSSRNPTMWCWSPARGTKSTRSSATRCCRSTTWRWRAKRSQDAGPTRASYDGDKR